MNELKQKIAKLLSIKDSKGAVKEIKKRHATEVAEILKELDSKNRNLIFALLPPKLAANAFSYLHLKEQRFFLTTLKNTQVRILLSNLKPDNRTNLFENLPVKQAEKLLDLLSISDLKETKFLLHYPKESVGRAMTPDYISINKTWSVQRSLNYIRKNSKNVETADIIYITDEEEHLLNEIKLHKLILANPTSLLKDVLNESNQILVRLSPFDDQEKAVHLIKKYNRTALPVIDSANELLGIVTIDDLMDVQEEETTEDFHKIGAISRSERHLNNDLANASIGLVYKRRIWWLLVLVGVSFFSGAVLLKFGKIIEETVVLVAFLPLLIGSAGNAGAQASTIIVRALGTGHLKKNDWLKSILKEIAISGMLGVSMAIAVSILAYYIGGPKISLIVSLSMLAVVMIGSILGVVLPFILSKFKKDPATASGPLIASVIDIMGVVIYFSIATFVLGL
ncbi:MAG: magnesium transporter [Candidatus Magasanikbacteria bacterium]|nr:magnesium transporter [Candidatus Magasanikbacteria bacterium]